MYWLKKKLPEMSKERFLLAIRQAHVFHGYPCTQSSALEGRME